MGNALCLSAVCSAAAINFQEGDRVEGRYGRAYSDMCYCSTLLLVGLRITKHCLRCLAYRADCFRLLCYTNNCCRNNGLLKTSGEELAALLLYRPQERMHHVLKRLD